MKPSSGAVVLRASSMNYRDGIMTHDGMNKTTYSRTLIMSRVTETAKAAREARGR